MFKVYVEFDFLFVIINFVYCRKVQNRSNHESRGILLNLNSGSRQIIPVLISGTKYGRILNKNLYDRAFSYFGNKYNFKKEKKTLSYMYCMY
jgi:hypothetical protein